MIHGEFWTIPAKDGLPQLYVIQEASREAQTFGDDGQRPMTAEEKARWIIFKADLRKKL